MDSCAARDDLVDRLLHANAISDGEAKFAEHPCFRCNPINNSPDPWATARCRQCLGYYCYACAAVDGGCFEFCSAACMRGHSDQQQMADFLADDPNAAIKERRAARIAQGGWVDEDCGSAGMDSIARRR